MIYTPGGDLYVELSKDWRSLFYLSGGDGYPSRLGGHIVAFAKAINPTELDGLLAQAGRLLTDMQKAEPSRPKGVVHMKGVRFDSTIFGCKPQ